MAAEKNTEGLAFLIEALKANKDAVYADVKAAAEKKGLTVWPIMFGRAKLTLGYVKAGSGATKKAAAAKAAGGRRGPGRPPKAVTADAPPKRGPGRPRKVVTVDAPKRGPGRPPKVAAPVFEAPRRGPGRPRKVPVMAGSLEAIVDAVKASQRDLARYQDALARIRSVLDGAQG